MLTRSQPMRRTAALKSKPRPAVPSHVRELLQARSSGWCEARLPGCTGQATDACHRIARKAGGRPNGVDARLSNVWHGCRTCHLWATANPVEAYELGLALKEHQDPTIEPMAYQSEGWVRLDDDGGLWPT